MGEQGKAPALVFKEGVRLPASWSYLDTRLVVLRVQHARKYIMNEVSTPSRRSRLNGHAGWHSAPPSISILRGHPRYFFANNATATLFFAMLSGFFPPASAISWSLCVTSANGSPMSACIAAIAGFMGQKPFMVARARSFQCNAGGAWLRHGDAGPDRKWR